MRRRGYAVTALGLLAALLLVACRRGAMPAPGGITVTSAAFPSGGPIPARYTCEGEDIPPPLAWEGVPRGAAALALVVDDPDAPGGVFTHWTVYNLPPDLNGLPEGAGLTAPLPPGALEGRNDFGVARYRGPCPPAGPAHRYRFRLYALSAPLDLPAGASPGDVRQALEGRVLAYGELVGTFHR